jgi:tRNA 2-thiouridine synthesizing protein B
MLHVVNKSPFEKNSLATCIRLSAEGSSILLIEDAVYGGFSGNEFEADLKDALASKKVYALEPDLKARGIANDKLIQGVQTVDYEGFVNLAAESTNTQSWL